MECEKKQFCNIFKLRFPYFETFSVIKIKIKNISSVALIKL